MTVHPLLKWLIGALLLLLALLSGPLYVALSGQVELSANWRNADRTSAGLAPAPADHSEAVLQIYAARAFSWRGAGASVGTDGQF